MKRHLWKIVIGVLILLAITNPTQSDLEKYTSTPPTETNYNNMNGVSSVRRTFYFLFFSIYRYEYISEVQKKETELIVGDIRYEGHYGHKILGYNHQKATYIGIFKNFINISFQEWFTLKKE